MASLSFRGVHKSYDSVPVLHRIDMEVSTGEFLVLVGPSGCGKSTLLRCIAGLEQVSGGEILIDGKVVNDMAPRDRDVAMVFQSYALYPHMTVRQNMGFALALRKVPEDAVRSAVDEAAEMLDLGTLLDRYPKELSGGQRQRVAMGRAIVRKPQVFLFDEPLSNLDASLRTQLRLELKQLHSRLGTTMVYVTHDQVEAMTLADRIAVLNDGHLQQVGTPAELYNEPKNRFVAGFMGTPAMSFLEGVEEDVVLGVRPHQAEIVALGAQPPPPGVLVGTLLMSETLGFESFLHVELDPIVDGNQTCGRITVRVEGEMPAGPRVGVRLTGGVRLNKSSGERVV